MWSTPPEVYPFIAKYAKGRKFLDLGCGQGKVMAAMRGIAGKVVGIDDSPMPMYPGKLIGDFTKDYSQEIVSADVLYMWCGNPELRLAQMVENGQNTNGVLLIGAHGKREVEFLHSSRTTFVEIEEIPFEEGKDYPGGKFYVGVMLGL
jgi:SAM-dependent methyltransferase